MLEVLRFWFTKDLVCFHFSLILYPAHLLILPQKYIKGKPCKPYNSTLGEFFRVRAPMPLEATSFAKQHLVLMGR